MRPGGQISWTRALRRIQEWSGGKVLRAVTRQKKRQPLPDLGNLRPQRDHRKSLDIPFGIPGGKLGREQGRDRRDKSARNRRYQGLRKIGAVHGVQDRADSLELLHYLFHARPCSSSKRFRE